MERLSVCVYILIVGRIFGENFYPDFVYMQYHSLHHAVPGRWFLLLLAVFTIINRGNKMDKVWSRKEMKGEEI